MRLSLALLFCALATPALAGETECAAITKAWQKVADAPGYRQHVAMSKPAMEMDMVVIGDEFYVKTDKSWSKQSFGAGGRKQIVAQYAGKLAAADCKLEGEEVLEGAPTLIYSFTRAPMANVETGPVPQKLWLGKADGLVRKLTSPTVSVTVAYDKVEPPIK